MENLCKSLMSWNCKWPWMTTLRVWFTPRDSFLCMTIETWYSNSSRGRMYQPSCCFCRCSGKCDNLTVTIPQPKSGNSFNVSPTIWKRSIGKCLRDKRWRRGWYRVTLFNLFFMDIGFEYRSLVLIHCISHNLPPSYVCCFSFFSYIITSCLLDWGKEGFLWRRLFFFLFFPFFFFFSLLCVSYFNRNRGLG
ncbi:hypothetical protein Tc00.1047053509733.20 [Trypanosoma cruzi]|uniref:Uncharacterized protein n=1 Tax=Trypanosoma cruzi (strain CL Brener) TaxID=353153 RepID=Q4DWD2_TRYCC|nr:hypothetical protein Tc00.1047053509733.20 [Trypanosoma cruzi]EAN96833.1 hypothetical protein Tc00.1047053509733.20 [Trypanosoma cruzi]|eukprot:XP_818684.1 hypothetical protein [Trypanosoma cruzi strain CL Brener]